MPLSTLEYAARVVGGEEELARRLGVEPAELERWLRGGERPPLGVFLRAADIVHDAAVGELQRKGDFA